MRRKFLFFLLIFSASVLTVSCQTKSGGKIRECKYLSFAEAEKILGTRVALVSNSWTFRTDVNRFECSYRAIEKDAASGKDINLFFLLEESSTENQAKEAYEKIWRSNKHHQGIETLSGIGDEAYFHSDRQNFHFLMARKGNFSIRFKIAKAAETTLPEELKAFAKKVIGQI